MFLGIDPSLTATALAWHDSAAKIIRTEPSKFACFSARLEHILRQVLVFTRSRELVLVAVEGLALGKHTGQAAERAALQKTILWRLWREDVPTLEVPPTTLKKFVTGHGVAEKSLMIREVFKKWGYNALEDNDADAYALSRLAEAYVEGKAKWHDELRKKLPVTQGRQTQAALSAQPQALSTLRASRSMRSARRRAP